MPVSGHGIFVRIVCAESVLCGAEVFGGLGDVVILPDEEISSASVREADALVIRSTTPVRRDLLDQGRIQIVGSATSGTDHLDTAYLEQHDIAWTAAAGCNANSVAEYVVAALLVLVERHGYLLPDMTLGVVGVGHVGSRVARKARALGMRVLQNDPPRRLAEGGTAFVELDQLLEESDAVTVHVPLTHDGPFATFHLANHRFFEKLPGGALFINTSRGGIVDSEALLTALNQGVVLAAAVDVWEGEPDVPAELISRADIATPHIAGYSFEGKLNGTRMVHEAFCGYFEVESHVDYAAFLPPSEDLVLDLDDRGRLVQDVLREAACRACGILEDDRTLRRVLEAPRSEWSAHVRALRREYPLRREFDAWSIRAGHLDPGLSRALAEVGFRLPADGPPPRES